MARLRTHKEIALTTSTIEATSTGVPKEIATTLFKLGATSYGGPAIMGFMQAELQERRKWVSKERFVEGLAVSVVSANEAAVRALLAKHLAAQETAKANKTKRPARRKTGS